MYENEKKNEYREFDHSGTLKLKLKSHLLHIYQHQKYTLHCTLLVPS